MSRASALLEREVHLQEFYSPAPTKQSRSKAQNLHRVLGNNEKLTGSTSQAYQAAEELFRSPLPISPINYADEETRSRAVIAGRDTGAHFYSYDTAAYQSSPPVYYQEPWHGSSQFHVDASPQGTRFRLLGKRLPLFIILSLMALGLVVAITTVLARGKATLPVRQSRLALSGYVAGSSVSQVDSADNVPVIDVTSKPPASEDTAKVPSEISNPKAGGDILGSPSISVAGIESVLKKYGSPAAGKGQALYDLGVKYGINPAYALAFFVHESGCGTKGVARFTKSLGNIRTTAGYADYQGYRSYTTWEAGMEDWYKLISDQYVNQWGLRTLDAIIPVYAPWGDNNNPPTYIASVKGMVDSWRGK